MLKSLPLNVINGYLEPPNVLFKTVGQSILLDLCDLLLCKSELNILM